MASSGATRSEFALTILEARVGGQRQIRHARRHAARELVRAEQAERVVLQHVGGAGEAHVRRVVGRLLALPRMVQVAQGGEGVGPRQCRRRAGPSSIGTCAAPAPCRRRRCRPPRRRRSRARPEPAAIPARRARGNRACADTASGRPGKNEGVHQRRPHLFVHAVGRRHPLRLAERAHRPCRDVAVHAVDALLRKEAERGQALLHVFHGRPGVVSLNSVHCTSW